MKKPTVYRCSRCHELRNGKPARVLDKERGWLLCQVCLDETSEKAASAA
jgi:formylmethanofuran dehydrogenase subunit E